MFGTAAEDFTPPDATRSAYAAFVRDQMKAATQIGFAVTEACPLRCDHCSVGANRKGNGKVRAMGPSFAREVAGQVPHLRAMGIRELAFTGGEPLLCRPFLRHVSAAAEEAAMACSVVTSGFWARDVTRARAVARDHRAIRRWNISTDVYHLPQVPLAQVRTAYEALRDQGSEVLIRFTFHEPLTREDARLIDQIVAFAGEDITFQQLMPAGRARDLPQARANALTAAARECACPSSGPVVRPDGAVEPCCSDLYRAQSSHHPLLMGNAFVEGLPAIIHRWRTSAVLQTLRLWGTRCPRRWLLRAREPFSWDAYPSICGQCVALAHDPRLYGILERRSREPGHLRQVGESLSHHFMEPWLADELNRGAAREQEATQ